MSFVGKRIYQDGSEIHVGQHGTFHREDGPAIGQMDLKNGGSMEDLIEQMDPPL
jgi:hypothetical protein